MNKSHVAKGMHRWLAISLLLLAACNQSIKPMAQSANFPVVKAFDLAHAGSKVEVDFTLPNAMDGDNLRPVFIGYRSPGPKGRPDLNPGNLEYLDRQDMPIRIRLWRIEAGKRVPVVLQEQQQDLSTGMGRYWYELHPSAEFIDHGGGSQDIEELMALGQYRMRLNYLIWDIARIVPPTPGQYHLEVESLQNHPQVTHLPFEILVSHYFEKGIY